MRKVQTAALRRKLISGVVDVSAAPARRAFEALAEADQMIDRAFTGTAPWRDAAAHVIVARGAVADALAVVARARDARTRVAEKLLGPRPARRRST